MKDNKCYRAPLLSDMKLILGYGNPERYLVQLRSYMDEGCPNLVKKIERHHPGLMSLQIVEPEPKTEAWGSVMTVTAHFVVKEKYDAIKQQELRGSVEGIRW